MLCGKWLSFHRQLSSLLKRQRLRIIRQCPSRHNPKRHRWRSVHNRRTLSTAVSSVGEWHVNCFEFFHVFALVIIRCHYWVVWLATRTELWSNELSRCRNLILPCSIANYCVEKILVQSSGATVVSGFAFCVFQAMDRASLTVQRVKDLPIDQTSNLLSSELDRSFTRQCRFSCDTRSAICWRFNVHNRPRVGRI